jgi:hypothetical protein
VSWTDEPEGEPEQQEPASTLGPSSSALSETLRPNDTMYPSPADPEAPERESGLIDALPWQVDRGWRGDDAPSSNPAHLVPTPQIDASAAAPTDLSVPAAAVDLKPPNATAEQATVNRAALLAAAQLGPSVKAVRCASGHLSPPQFDVCRVCQAPVAAQNVFTAPRPVLGTIRLSTGDVVTLDRDVVLGRAPESRAGTNAADRPHVVKLASPENDISRNHVEIRLDGWHVLIVDLESVNGTVVTLPGQPPQRLRPNQGLAIEPGTLVTLADEVSFVYEVGA